MSLASYIVLIISEAV